MYRFAELRDERILFSLEKGVVFKTFSCLERWHRDLCLSREGQGPGISVLLWTMHVARLTDHPALQVQTSVCVSPTAHSIPSHRPWGHGAASRQADLIIRILCAGLRVNLSYKVLIRVPTKQRGLEHDWNYGNRMPLSIVGPPGFKSSSSSCA